MTIINATEKFQKRKEAVKQQQLEDFLYRIAALCRLTKDAVSFEIKDGELITYETKE